MCTYILQHTYIRIFAQINIFIDIISVNKNYKHLL